MQYSGECWAGNAVGKYGKRPDTECNMKCKKDNSRICGAGWRNSVFKLVVTQKSYKSVVGETPEGCYVDTGNRDMPYIMPGGSNSYKACFEMAMKKGLKYAAL